MNDARRILEDKTINSSEKIVMLALDTAPRGDELNIAQLSRLTGLAYSTTHRAVARMKSRGFIEVNGLGAWATLTLTYGG